MREGAQERERMTTEFYQGDCVEVMRSMPADRYDLVFGSPPYCDARTYGIDAQRDCESWVAWMLDVTEAAARVCKGPVIWVAAGVTRKRNYWPACEGLMWEWWRRHGTHELYRPCVFHRVGIPGSGGKDWFRADWEYVMCFKRPGALVWSDNTACGHPPKWAPGGEMSNRQANGARVNGRDQWGRDCSTGNRDKNGKRKPQQCNKKWGDGGAMPETRDGDAVRVRKVQTRRKKDGTRPGAHGHDGMHNQEQDYQEPVLANPGNVFKMNVGGGVMGSKLAHENEAPFPEKLAEIFVRSCCQPDGWCLDPFIGSGTTASVCAQWGRNCAGIDLRLSQVELSRRRVVEVQRVFA